MNVGRVFAAVVPPPEIALAVADRLSTVRIPGRPVPVENLHLTLRFFGDISQVEFEKLAAALDGGVRTGPVRIRLLGLGAFPNARKASVLWLDVAAPLLNDLVAQVETAAQVAGFAAEERPYRPHVTLARIRPPQDVRALIESTEPVEWAWKATSFHLMAAHGSRYRFMETFSLA